MKIIINKKTGQRVEIYDKIVMVTTKGKLTISAVIISPVVVKGWSK